MLQPGQTFTVPPTAAAPVLKTGKPEALRINVGNAVAPPVGPPATTITNVSLLPADLLKGAQRQRPRRLRGRASARAEATPARPPTGRARSGPAPADRTPPTTNTGE